MKGYKIRVSTLSQIEVWNTSINCGKEKYISKNKVATLSSLFHSKQIQRMKKTYQGKKEKKKWRKGS